MVCVTAIKNAVQLQYRYAKRKELFMDQDKIGKFISISRKDKGLTQKQLAEELGVSINAVSKWERGLNLPDASLMKELCMILGVTLNELFEGEKLTSEEIVMESEKKILSLMMTLRQLKIVETLIQILIGLAIALTISSGFILETLNQKIIFVLIGIFIWGFGIFLKVQVRKTIDLLEQ